MRQRSRFIGWSSARSDMAHRPALLVSALLSMFLMSALVLTSATAGAATTAEGWGPAVQVSGSSSTAISQVTQMSCTQSGDCSAFGTSNNSGSFLVSEVGGTWGSAQSLQSLCASCIGIAYTATMISCSSAGNCALSGNAMQSGVNNAMVDLETNGVWGAPTQVPGVTSLNADNGSSPDAISCDSSGDCTLVGGYGANDGTSNRYPFVSYEIGGNWSSAVEIPSVATLATNGYAAFRSLSCQSGGTCTGVGAYRDGSHVEQAFVADESAGTWSTPETPATTSALSDEVSATLLSVSCSTGGNCSAGGSYEQSTGPSQPIVVSEVGGIWGSAVQVPGISSLNVGPSGGRSAISRVDSISCTDTGDCSIGGFYTDASDLGQDFVDSQVSGTWDTAAPLPHTTTSVGNGSEVLSVSCWSDGNCNAGGDFARHDMVAPERSGVWGVPISPAAGVANANYPSQVLTISCASDGSCGAGGDYAVLTSGHIYDIPFDSSYSAAPLATLPGRPTIVSVVPGDLSLTVKWSAGTTGGIPVTYTASASSGGGSCQSSGTSCVIAVASATRAYAVTVAASNEVGNGPSSLPTVALYPFRPKHFLAEASSSIQSKKVSFTVFAGDAKPHAVIKFTFAGASKTCTANSLGQCSVALVGKTTGVFKVKVSSSSSRATISIYFPLVKAPSTVAHGSSATIKVTSCPSNAKVQLALSDSRQFTGRASTSGVATFSVPMPTAPKESVTTQVSGSTLAPPIVIKVT